MIDTNELRRLAQAATPGPWIGCGPSFGESLPKFLNEVVVDREGDEDDGDSVCTTPIGLEDQCSDDMAFIAAANPAAVSELLDHLEAAEKERDAAELMSLALRAKIAEMEKQFPICRIKDIRRAHYMTKVVGLDPEAWLYALPGAQSAPSMPDVDALAQFIREVDGSHQLGAGVLAERIAEWLKAAPDAKP